MRADTKRGKMPSTTAARDGVATAIHAVAAGLKLDWRGCLARPDVEHVSNERVYFDAPGLSPGIELSDARVLCGKRTIIDGVDLLIEDAAGARVAAVLRPRAGAIPDVGAVIAEFATCAELLGAAARAGAFALYAPGCSAVALVREARTEPHTGLLLLRTDPALALRRGGLAAGSVEVQGRRYAFVSEVVRPSPLTIRVPEKLEETSRVSWPPPFGGDDGATVVAPSPLGGGLAPKRLLDLSPTSVTFDFDPAEDRYPPGLRLPSVVVRGPRSELGLRGRVQWVRAIGPDTTLCRVALDTALREASTLVARGAPSPLEGSPKSSGTVPLVEEIVDRARVLDVLRWVAHAPGAFVTLRTARGRAYVVEPPMIDGDVLRWHGRVPHSAHAEIALCGSVYRFRVVAPRAGSDVSSMPESLLRVRQRWFRRARVQPDDPLRFVGRRVHEISYAGVDVDADASGLRLGRGDEASATATEPSGPSQRVPVDVLAIEPAGGRLPDHVRVAPRSASADESWGDLVGGRLHPNTRSGYAWTDALWSLYDAAGYFSLSGKTAADFEASRQSFHEVARRLDDAPHLGCHVVYPSRAAGAAGALSVLKVYGRSWLGCQMAKVKGDTPEGVSGRAVLRDLHLHAYEHVQRDPELEWLIGYLQVKPLWSRIVHYDLPERYTGTDRACIVRFQAVEIAAALHPDEADVGPPTDEETGRIFAALARTHPASYLRALDLTPSRFDMRATIRAWSAAGLARSRSTLVARAGGMAVAAAILESGQEGSHLFRLLDLVRLVPLAPGAPSAYGALLRQAARWFAGQGKRSFVLFREEPIAVDWSGVDVVRDMGLADMTILSATLLPELLERVYEVTVRSAGTSLLPPR